MNNKLQIQIVTHNSKHLLEKLFLGIENQKNVEYSILIIDNNSTDGTLEWIKQNHSDVGVISNSENIGFSKAHNMGFEKCESEYVLVLNHDVELLKACLSELIHVIEQDKQIASVIPKQFRTLPNNENSGIIDSLGLSIKPWAQIVNIGENKLYKAKDNLQNKENKQTQQVWGASGSCVLYRMKALKQVKDKYGIFDERFWMYKEDADLSWRLNRKQLKTIVVSNATAIHTRGVVQGDRDTRTDTVKQQSIQNHLLLLKKNIGFRDLWRLPFVLVYELLKFIYTLLFDTKNLKAYGFIYNNTKL